MPQLFLMTFLYLNGTATEYFVSKSCIVSIYQCPLSVIGSGPMISIVTLLNAVPGVSREYHRLPAAN